MAWLAHHYWLPEPEQHRQLWQPLAARLKPLLHDMQAQQLRELLRCYAGQGMTQQAEQVGEGLGLGVLVTDYETCLLSMAHSVMQALW